MTKFYVKCRQMVQSCNPSTQKAEAEYYEFEDRLSYRETLSQRNKGWGCITMVEFLPSMHMALGLNLETVGGDKTVLKPIK
jgi:hypothetical protein